MVLLNNPRDFWAWRACDWLFGPHFMMIGRPICTIRSVKIEWPISNFSLKDEKNEKICGQMRNNNVQFLFLQWDFDQEFPPRVEKLFSMKKKNYQMFPKCVVQFLILSRVFMVGSIRLKLVQCWPIYLFVCHYHMGESVNWPKSKVLHCGARGSSSPIWCSAIVWTCTCASCPVHE